MRVSKSIVKVRKIWPSSLLLTVFWGNSESSIEKLKPLLKIQKNLLLLEICLYRIGLCSSAIWNLWEYLSLWLAYCHIPFKMKCCVFHVQTMTNSWKSAELILNVPQTMKVASTQIRMKYSSSLYRNNANTRNSLIFFSNW